MNDDVISERLDNFMRQTTASLEEIKKQVTTQNGNVAALTLRHNAHDRHHEIKEAYSDGRKSVFGDIHIGWKLFVGAIGVVQLLGGFAVAVYFLVQSAAESGATP